MSTQRTSSGLVQSGPNGSFYKEYKEQGGRLSHSAWFRERKEAFIKNRNDAFAKYLKEEAATAAKAWEKYHQKKALRTARSYEDYQKGGGRKSQSDWESMQKSQGDKPKPEGLPEGTDKGRLEEAWKRIHRKDSALRVGLIRLAAENPDFRDEILSLLK